MYSPPPDRQSLEAHTDPTPGSVAVSLLLAAAVPFALWAASRPVAGTAVLAVAVVVATGARRVPSLARCYRACGEFSLHLGERVRVTVVRPNARDPC